MLTVHQKLDVRNHLDQMYTRYGIAAAEHFEMHGVVHTLLGAPRRRVLGVLLLGAGLAVGTASNMLSAVATG